MFEQIIPSSVREDSDPFERTRSVYESERVVEEYREKTTDAGLFTAERKVFDRYFTDPGARVLDLGCGVGRTTRALAERGFDVIGVDISVTMVRRAREEYPDLDVRVGDATALDFPTDEFDYVLFSHGGLDYSHPERKRLEALREIRRVLKPGGLFVFAGHNSLYAIPALLLGPEFLRNFYLSRKNVPRLFDRYKFDHGEHDLETYLIDPFRQRRQLRRVGFEFVECIGKRESLLRYFEFQPHYVARKPASGQSDR